MLLLLMNIAYISPLGLCESSGAYLNDEWGICKKAIDYSHSVKAIESSIEYIKSVYFPNAVIAPNAVIFPFHKTIVGE